MTLEPPTSSPSSPPPRPTDNNQIPLPSVDFLYFSEKEQKQQDRNIKKSHQSRRPSYRKWNYCNHCQRTVSKGIAICPVCHKFIRSRPRTRMKWYREYIDNMRRY